MMHLPMGDMATYAGGYPMMGDMAAFVGGYPMMGNNHVNMGMADSHSRWGSGDYPNPSAYHTSAGANAVFLTGSDPAHGAHPSPVQSRGQPVSFSNGPSLPPFSMSNPYHPHTSLHQHPM
jgi:hypothetical protein